MWTPFSKANALVQSLSGWLTVMLGLAGLFSWLGKNLTVFGPIGWPEAIFIGLGAALVTMLVLSAVLAGWRRFRPLPPQSSSDAIDLGEAIGNWMGNDSRFISLQADVLAMQDQLRKAIERLEPAEINAAAALRDFQKMRDLEARLGDRSAIIEGRLDRAASGTALGFQTLFQALEALLARERVQRLTQIIIDEGSFLNFRVTDCQPVKGDEWLIWQGRKSTFDYAMQQWMDHARRWCPGVEALINTVKPEHLTASGRWAGIDTLFDGSDAVITYKTFHLIYENWRRQEVHVQSAIHVAAFGGPTAIEQLNGLAPPEPSLEAVRKVFGDGE